MTGVIEARERAAVVAEARSWIGTPYHHQGDIKGLGVDCAMIIVRVFCDLGLIPRFDPRPYSRDWMMHRDEERYLSWMPGRGNEVERPRPGDVVVWRHGRLFSHGGIVTEWSDDGPQLVVHAWAKARVVIESDVSLPGALSDHDKHPRKYFSYWGDRATSEALAA